MKRILNIHHILQMVSGFVILLSTSCEHKDLCYDHSHTTKIQVIFDWKNAPDATPETMRLYLFPGAVLSTYLPAVIKPCASIQTRSPCFTATSARSTVLRLTLPTEF